MKNIFISFFILVGFAEASTLTSTSSPLSSVVTVQGVWNQSSQKFLLDNARQMLARSLGYDPFNNHLTKITHFETPLTVAMADLMRDILHGFLHGDLSQITLKVDIEGARYRIDDPGLYISMEETHDPRKISTTIHTKPQGLLVSADKVTLSFNAPPESPLSEMVLKLSDVRLSSREMKALSLAIPMQIEFGSDGRSQFTFDSSIQDLFKAIRGEELQEDIDLQPTHAEVVGGLSLQIGGVQMDVNEEKLLKAIQVRKKYISLLILKPVAEFLGKLPAVLSEKYMHGNNFVTFPSRWTFSFLDHKLDLAILGAEPFNDQLRINLGINADGTPLLVNQPAQDSLTEVIEKNDAELAASIHESALGQLGTWLVESLLKDPSLKRLALGSEKIRVILADPQHPKIVGDLIVNASLAAKIVVGKKFIRVPVVIEPQLEVNYGTGFPVLTASVKSIELDDQTLLQGAYGIQSDLEHIRFKKRVAKILRKIVKKKMPQLCKDIPLPKLAGQRFDYAKISGDGQDRLNIFLKLDPTENASAQTFWSGLADWFKKIWH